MCGIAGFIDFSSRSNEQILRNMTDEISYRGPDDCGYMVVQNDFAQIGLGHRRLSIIDLSKHGHQPMHFENYTIIYNGEVYNFLEIRQELEKYGYKFVSNSDTEVILKSFHKWGIDSVQRFNGMFAIVIFDKIESKITLVRDRSGIKPLFWYYSNDLFLFASELKCFSQHPQFKKILDENSIVLYLKYGYIPQPYSIFKNVRKLNSGNFLEIDLKCKIVNEQSYWDVLNCYMCDKLNISESEALDETENLLNSSFRYRMVSDVPVGVFLSGGYDSTLVTTLLQKGMTERLKTFTIGFHEKKYNEAPFAKEIAKYLGTDHTEYYCTPKDAADIIPLLPEIYDEPFADNSAIPTILVSKLSREKVTVILSADGGDEIFGGYPKYERSLYYQNVFNRIPLKNYLYYVLDRFSGSKIPILNNTFNFENRYERFKAFLKSKDIINYLDFYQQYFINGKSASLLRQSTDNYRTNFCDYASLLDGNDKINSMMAIDYRTYMMDDILTKVDRATMSVSLEGREPFLDYRIIEYISRLPGNYKIKGSIKKYLIKEITHKYIPEKLMDRPKMGFSVPIYDWFRNDLKEFYLKYLSESNLNQQSIFDTKKIIALRNAYFDGKNEYSDQLWLLLQFQMWYEKWM